MKNEWWGTTKDVNDDDLSFKSIEDYFIYNCVIIIPDKKNFVIAYELYILREFVDFEVLKI